MVKSKKQKAFSSYIRRPGKGEPKEIRIVNRINESGEGVNESKPQSQRKMGVCVCQNEEAVTTDDLHL